MLAMHAAQCRELVQDPSPFHTVARGVTPASATTNWSRVAMLIRPMSVPADDVGGEQIR